MVPISAPTETGHTIECEHTPGASARTKGPRWLKAVFDFGIELRVWGSKLKTIAAIEDVALIECMLTRRGLSAQLPPRAAARRFDLVPAGRIPNADGSCRWPGRGALEPRHRPKSGAANGEILRKAGAAK
jgi:hypothetical protein